MTAPGGSGDREAHARPTPGYTGHGRQEVQSISAASPQVSHPEHPICGACAKVWGQAEGPVQSAPGRGAETTARPSTSTAGIRPGRPPADGSSTSTSIQVSPPSGQASSATCPSGQATSATYPSKPPPEGRLDADVGSVQAGSEQAFSSSCHYHEPVQAGSVQARDF